MVSIDKTKLKRSRRYAVLAGAAIVTALGLPGTQTGNAQQTQVQPAQKPQAPQHHWYQIGRASWYGRILQGHPTASGENYDMNGLTCAHRSLPLGSLVRVTNLTNHKSVVVRVNDRGPMPENRIIDLSYAAAHFLGFNGTAKVRVDLVDNTAQLAQVLFPLNPTLQHTR
ncbi:septal ring lytic transglycosylase RlpA family protein [Silvibacterium sp.]|uniref:septal ring lytic transglycosylase RlpA family protein n=1 Tax=Silvibacterium sp. TaxID=1964179 RepID=UPI0039E23978